MLTKNNYKITQLFVLLLHLIDKYLPKLFFLFFLSLCDIFSLMVNDNEDVLNWIINYTEMFFYKITKNVLLF